MTLPQLSLARNEERRLRGGHVWIYSNEVDNQRTPLKGFAPGDQVTVVDSRGKPLGSAFINPHTLIAGRLYTRRPDQPFEAGLFARRLDQARALRERFYAEPYYRLAFGDSDGLPGLVIDRYGDILVAQVGSAGMERVWAELLPVLVKRLEPRGILLRNDTPARSSEGLDQAIEIAYGEVPAEVEIRENGVQFTVPVHEGQKTGWFYDHRENRAQLNRIAQGARVLDVFSYIGGWGVQAAAAGAREVLCVDASESALARVLENAARNGVAERLRTQRGDALEVMKELVDAGERFDIVVLDPPAFIKRKKDHAAGLGAYHRINELALRLLDRDGLLVSASCSMHLAREELREVLRSAGRHVDRHLQLVAEGGQAPDHPVLPAIPETDYLKALFARVTATF